MESREKMNEKKKKKWNYTVGITIIYRLLLVSRSPTGNAWGC